MIIDKLKTKPAKVDKKWTKSGQKVDKLKTKPAKVDKRWSKSGQIKNITSKRGKQWTKSGQVMVNMGVPKCQGGILELCPPFWGHSFVGGQLGGRGRPQNVGQFGKSG